MARRKNKLIVFDAYGKNRYDALSEKQNNTIGARMAELRKSTGMSLATFSSYLKEYGVSIESAALFKWETGATVPNAYQLVAFCAAMGIEDVLKYFCSSHTPLLNEEGRKKVEEYKADLIASGRYKPESKLSEVIRYIEKPVSTLPVSAGTGAFLDNGNFELLSFPENSVPEGAEFGVYVSGDSMEPVYRDGQIVWVQQCERLRIGEVGIFVYDNQGYLKAYYEQEPDDSLRSEYTDSYGICHSQPVLVSLNKKYEPIITVPSANFHIVGRIL